MRNIVLDGRVGLLFLVPGFGTTVRVNGTALLRTDPELRERYRMQGKLPDTVIEISVQVVYTQCPKALIRSDVWNPERFHPAADLPTAGAIMAEITEGAFDGAAYDAGYPQRSAESIYWSPPAGGAGLERRPAAVVLVPHGLQDERLAIARGLPVGIAVKCGHQVVAIGLGGVGSHLVGQPPPLPVGRPA